MLDRDNMAELKQEAEFKKQGQNIKGADFVITGNVTEFGRKDAGDKQLFGIMGRGKTQVAHAKVTLNVVNIATSEVVYSSSGASEYSLSNREVLGFGGTVSYDATLNGKVLDLTMREAVERLGAGVEAGALRKQYGADDMKIAWECQSWCRGRCLLTWLAQAVFPPATLR